MAWLRRANLVDVQGFSVQEPHAHAELVAAVDIATSWVRRRPTRYSTEGTNKANEDTRQRRGRLALRIRDDERVNRSSRALA